MDCTLNIVSKIVFVFMFKRSRAPKRSWEIFPGVLEKWKVAEKSWIFLPVKEWEW